MWGGLGGIRRSVAALAVMTLVIAAPAAASEIFEDVDARGGSLAPSAQQLAIVNSLGAHASWNEFGTPRSLVRFDGYLAEGLAGSSAASAAKSWLGANKALFRLASADSLRVVQSVRLRGSSGYAVLFQQRFGDLKAAESGQVVVGVVGNASNGWKVAYASSSLTGNTALTGAVALTPQQAWLKAAENVGRAYSVADIRGSKNDRSWTVFAVGGLTKLQRARLVAVPTAASGVRVAYETLFVDVAGGSATAFQHYVDAQTGAVLIRKNIVEHSHPPSEAFTGDVPAADAACAPKEGPWTVTPSEQVGTVVVGVEATLTTNDSVIKLYRDGSVVASQDTLTSPEALVYDPADDGQGTYEVEVCDFPDGFGWDPPRSYVGQIVFNPAEADFPYPPMWKVFPATPDLGGQQTPWNYPSTDTRELWCWVTTVGFPPQPVTGPGGEECDREVANLASRAPWDHDVRTDTPTFTTKGNNAKSAEAWTSPLTPGATAFMPVSPERQYVYPWQNTWFQSKCNPSSLVASQEPDLPAAVTNLFAMHNRLHDWDYFLGFTERTWNAQDSNFGTGGTLDRDPLQGDVQAGALTGGAPSYLGRDNANMVPLPDGVPPITNMYLWQPLAGAFYAPCVDGDFDMAVIGHEFGHLTENRMIGKGGTRSGHHAGAMGESFGDFHAAEYLNEYDFVPVDGENPFSVGAYVTGNKNRAIRNFNMSWPRTGALPAPGVAPRINPLQFGDMGYDLTGAQVHADGEMWSAVNFDIRRALADKYDASFPASNQQLQENCADGRRPANLCPGNRRWIQIVFDAMLLMPVGPSMLDARDAYLAADMMRFGGANQAELWFAFARRGFGQRAFSTNASDESDTDPRPNHMSPLHSETNVTFRAVAVDEGNAPITRARIFVGRYEARVSPIADTNPATSATNPPPSPGVTDNLSDTVNFVAGTYEFVARAPGYGHVRWRSTFSGTGDVNFTIRMATNRASKSKGAVASGDGERFNALIDDTEGTNWERTEAAPNVRGSKVTVDLQGGVQRVERVQVSAMLLPGQNRFTALRQFAIETCTASAANGNCGGATGWTRRLRSAENAFPGFNPRPVSPELILRSFTLATPVNATHVRIVVLDNQCTGNPAFQGSQDADPANGTDCREGSPGEAVPPFELPTPQVLTDRDDEVRIAELQVFSH